MSIEPGTGYQKSIFCLWCILILFTFVAGVQGFPGSSLGSAEPVVHLNFNEGSGGTALNAAGSGSGGTLHAVTRVENSGCGRSIVFNGINSYVTIPYSHENHPANAVSTSLWFFIDDYNPKVLISTYNNGGYKLGFDDGGDLWWTVNLEGSGDVSIPVQHENITLRQWHHLAGIYDGTSSKIYLDGVLRSRVNASGAIHYQFPNYVMIGANAGISDEPDPQCPQFFRGGIDEVKIYDTGLTYGDVNNDQLSCSQEPEITSVQVPPVVYQAVCNPLSGSLVLDSGGSEVRDITFSGPGETAIWTIALPPGSKLAVKVRDHYAKLRADSWYVEIDDTQGRVDRGVQFPNTNNAPVEGTIHGRNATVIVRYFDGPGRFPSTVTVQFDSLTQPAAINPQGIISSNPIIVIYTASWATLIALILVMVWLHVRSKRMRK
ncbi:MAG: hypothetical protein METHP_00581 [Methanoregula sp. SKADARSKE-2]|jgi:hypothetical protein|nr:MAG: hypothetical protein METHP_00581 [Methanoregula sp. SKADARSKE-2]